MKNQDWKLEYEKEPDFCFWMENKTPCCALRNKQFGNWCAYCGVPEGSVLYEQTYDYKIKPINELIERELDFRKIGIIEILLMKTKDKHDCVRMSQVVRCHGGLTFSGKINFPEMPEEYNKHWWFGFDCGHCDDIIPKIDVTFLEDLGSNNKYRTLKYVKECVTEMVYDIKIIENSQENKGN